jgi:hypothetical protein
VCYDVLQERNTEIMGLSEFSDFLKQTEKTWLGLLIASGVLWLFPQLVISGDTANKSDLHLGVAVPILFILSASMLISSFTFHVRDSNRDRRAKDAKFEVLKRLTPPERELLRRYLKAETKSMGQDSRDPTVILFISRKWLSQPCNYVGITVGAGGEPFLPPHVLADWIYDHLKDNPELIA